MRNTSLSRDPPCSVRTRRAIEHNILRTIDNGQMSNCTLTPSYKDSMNLSLVSKKYTRLLVKFKGTVPPTIDGEERSKYR